MSYHDFKVRVRQGDPTDSLLFANLDSGTTYVYVGEVALSGAWMVMRYTNASKVMEYAWGADNYATNWTGRAALTYSAPPQG